MNDLPPTVVADVGLMDGPAAAAVAALVDGGPSALQPAQHIALLRWLADEALDSTRLRGVLTGRLNRAADGAADLRAAIGDER